MSTQSPQNTAFQPQTPPPHDRPSRGAVMVEGFDKEAAARQKTRNLRPLMRLLPYLAKERGDFLWMVFFLLLSSSAQLLLTVGLRFLVDNGFSSANKDSLDLGFLFLGAIALILAFATALRYFFITKLGERVVANLRIDVFAHALKLDPSFFHHIRTGEVISRLTTDIQIIDNLVSSAISIALRNIISFVGGLVLLGFVSFKLTLMVLLIFPFVLIPLFVYGKRVSQLTRATQDRFAGAVGLASEALEALETVQAFVREAFVGQRFKSSVDDSYRLSLKRIAARALMTAMIIGLVFGGVAGVLWLGAQDVLKGDMSVGTLVQFVVLAVLTAGAVASLSDTWGDVQKAAGAMERIDELLVAKPSITAPLSPKALEESQKGALSLKGVSFSYPSRPDQVVLEGIDIEIKSGELVAIVGPSGAGKSSLFRLLLRFYDPQAGKVCLGGVDIRELDPKHVRDQFAVVSQDLRLFSGSALDNIRFGREDASLEEAKACAREAQAFDFITALPSGFDEPLGEGAGTLSGGQRQRLAIARALIRHAPILLLDEATSALDAENERLVQAALDAFMGNRTTLVIAHRLATVTRADRILVIDEGRIVEEGKHSDLLAKNGLYARLARLQFHGEA